MTMLRNIVSVDGRFQRSARIDADLKGFPPLEGYILQESVRKALSGMTTALSEGGQAAFTWTGPYGGGKSSAALLVGSLVADRCEARAFARSLAGPALASSFSEAFPETNGSWAVIAVTGRRTGLRDEIALAASDVLGWSKAEAAAAAKDDRHLVDLLLNSVETRGGILLIIDELGKFLEHAVDEGGDVHLLQDLAERGARSSGRLVTVGVLHQSFAQYAARAGRDVRDEWAKIQGRFLDIPFLSATDEIVNLIGRAIRRSAEAPQVSPGLGAAVTSAVASRRPANEEELTLALSATWPLHPITALLLGPLSRQRFAQNERSVFGFLSSAEPSGFQEHLQRTAVDDRAVMFGPELLWDYLVANYGMALTDGVDGRRFSLAFEAIDRAAARGGPLHVRLIKIAALIEFFRNGSGLEVADDLMALAVPDTEPGAVHSCLSDLVDWSILMRQARRGGYALFAGSDFDLEEEMARVHTPLDRDVIASLPRRVGFNPIAAKRHYFDRGALRTFEPKLLLVSAEDARRPTDSPVLANELKLRDGSLRLILVLSDGSADPDQIESFSIALAKKLGAAGAIAAVGAAAGAVPLRNAATDLVALDRVAKDHPQLEGDRIARREIAARRSLLLDEVYREIATVFEGAKWFYGHAPLKTLRGESLATLASAVADEGFPNAPALHSELLQRDKPSSSAMAAVRELGHAMISNGSQANLGIENYPAERGVYMTVLLAFGLHRWVDGGWTFADPDTETDSGRSLLPAWSVMDQKGDLDLAEVFETWGSAPFGLKRGVMPILSLAFVLARRSALAIYVDNVFQPVLEPLFFDRLLQDPAAIRLKSIDRTREDARFLKVLGKGLGKSEGASPLDVASALFQRFEALTPYAKRTLRIDAAARAVRDLMLKATDPEELLFRDLPTVTEGDPGRALVALERSEAAYPEMLDGLKLALANALAVRGNFQGIADRARHVVDATGDLRFDAFAMRAGAFEGGVQDVEGLASLLVHKPPRGWTDREHDQALIELTRLGRMFRETEAVVAIRDRRGGAEALAVVVGLDPDTPPVIRRFDVSSSEREEADLLADRLMSILTAGSQADTVHLAAVARTIQRLTARSAELEPTR